jgi:zinc protease
VAGAIAGAEVFGLPADWFATYRDRIQGITPEQVHAAARAHVDPSRLLVLAVGDPAVIAGPLGALGVAPVETHATTDDPSADAKDSDANGAGKRSGEAGQA